MDSPYIEALTRTMNPKDIGPTALEYIDRAFNSASPQHEARRWEYGMALYSLAFWGLHHYGRGKPKPQGYDVGGAGSPFKAIAKGAAGELSIIDPAAGTGTLREEIAKGLPPRDMVFCISVLEHVEDLEEFVRDLAALVKPKGLLFITIDIWDRPTNEPDTAHFNWMRKRIFTLETWRALASKFWELGFQLLTPAEWDYKGDQLYGSYSFASLALVKMEAA